MITNLSDEILCVEVSDDLSSDGTIDLELVAQFGNSDDEELGGFLYDSLVELCIKVNSVVQLFLDLYLGPALLLCLSSTGLLARKGSSFGSLIFTFGIFLIDLLSLAQKH